MNRKWVGVKYALSRLLFGILGSGHNNELDTASHHNSVSTRVMGIFLVECVRARTHPPDLFPLVCKFSNSTQGEFTTLIQSSSGNAHTDSSSDSRSLCVGVRTSETRSEFAIQSSPRKSDGARYCSVKSPAPGPGASQMMIVAVCHRCPAPLYRGEIVRKETRLWGDVCSLLGGHSARTCRAPYMASVHRSAQAPPRGDHHSSTSPSRGNGNKIAILLLSLCLGGPCGQRGVKIYMFLRVNCQNR